MVQPGESEVSERRGNLSGFVAGTSLVRATDPDTNDMKLTKTKRTPRAFLTALLAGVAIIALSGWIEAQTVVKPRPAPPGSWTLIGTTTANFSIDHDSIIVRGPFDNFTKIMFKVTEAPLELHRLTVTYDNGEPDEIRVREKIKKGGESRAIDLKGVGRRSIRKIDFWYETRGGHGERAEVTVFGKK